MFVKGYENVDIGFERLWICVLLFFIIFLLVLVIYLELFKLVKLMMMENLWVYFIIK